MVLVGHDAVQARLVGHPVLLVVLVVQLVGLLWVEVGIWKVEASRLVPADILFIQVGVGLLGMEKDFHRIFHDNRSCRVDWSVLREVRDILGQCPPLR